ncbi:MAG TPA: MmcQ/YjbR family DNA-binding protein [Baekduia sp.]|nr:MmcQ/YjbR family DNA-binding protein [Baekduia sp.]
MRRIALALPETAEGTTRDNMAWKVRDKAFVLERPLTKADQRALGDDAPIGPILGAWVEHLVAKEALLADPSGVFFTTPHFDGYAMVLVQLDLIEAEDLRELIVEAWLARAPKKLVAEYLDSR